MIQYYLLIVGLLFSCNIIPFGVSADKINELKKEIEQMKFAERMLKTEHLQLTGQFSKLKKECDNETKQLEADDILAARNKEAMFRLGDVKKELHKKQVEEGVLVKALNRHSVIHAKYILQEELLQQDLNTLASRNVSGVAENCHKLEHLFVVKPGDLSVRSLAKSPSVVEKDTIITLQNDLNLHKLSVKKLQEKNKLLRQEIESYRKFCHKKIQDLKDVNRMAEEETNAITSHITSAQKELSEVVKSIAKCTKKLKETKQAIHTLREKVLILKRKAKIFSKDKDCYKKISEYYFEIEEELKSKI